MRLSHKMQAARLVPNLVFPPYTYVPGKGMAHPTRDKEGHSYNREEQDPGPLTESNWRDSDLYLFGFDLFNHGYYWEAHEAWEGIWHACGRKGLIADTLKALIKLAAAGVKALEGNPSGVRRAINSACKQLIMLQSQLAERPENFLGLDLADIAQRVLSLADESHPIENCYLTFQFSPLLEDSDF